MASDSVKGGLSKKVGTGKSSPAVKRARDEQANKLRAERRQNSREMAFPFGN